MSEHLPSVNLSSATRYWWNCTRCNFLNEHCFLLDPPCKAPCQACMLEHELISYKQKGGE
jgi:hypothetical protein